MTKRTFMFASGIPVKYIPINLYLLFKTFIPAVILFFGVCAVEAQNVPTLAPPQTPSTKIFFQDSACIRFEFRQPGAIIRYALNGEEPDVNSDIYRKPISITGSAVIKAKSFSKGFAPSETIAVKCIKTSGAIHTISGTAPTEPYNTNGLLAMMDNFAGGESIKERWLGFRGDTITWKVHFGKMQKIKKLHISLRQLQAAWVFYPVKIELLSLNGKTLGLAFFNGTTGPAEDESRVFSFPINKKVQGVIIRFQNLSSIPDWHPGKGNKPWLFADEIAVE